MMDRSWFDITVLAGAWLIYFAVHSLLASLTFKRWVATHWPDLMPAYRLMFNVAAVLLLIPIWWLMSVQSWPVVWQWTVMMKGMTNGLAVLAGVGFLWSLKFYDMQEFLGWRQWHGHVTSVEDQAQLKISPLHRFVRHPWYFFAMVIIWSRDLNMAQLASGVLISLYFIIGSRMEEQKLLVYYGERYRRYRQRVPGLFPLPWKYLRADEAQKLSNPDKA